MSNPVRTCYPMSLRLLQDRGFEARAVIDIGAARRAVAAR